MSYSQHTLGVIQNLGWLDRVLRFAVGATLLAMPCFLIVSGVSEVTWYLVGAMLLSVYPLLTSVIGIDQIYNFFHVKTCGTSNRNQCGTFPYEIDAALGNNPIPDNDFEHSLEHSHH
jgi:hypothetical protein